MGLEVTAKFPQFPDEYEFDIGGILVQNGKKLTLTDEQEQSFVARHEKAVKDYFEGSAVINVTGTGKISTADVKKMFPEPEPPQAVVQAEEEAAENTKEGSDT